MIQIDTREKPQAIAGIKKFFDRNGIEYIDKKMDIADYCVVGNETLVIDRKRNLQEVAQNLCSSDKSRFWREVRAAYENNIKMIILVEQSGINDLRDISKWNSKYQRLSGKRLQEEMFRVAIAYGVEWCFCHKNSTGRRIAELLGVDYGQRRN